MFFLDGYFKLTFKTHVFLRLLPHYIKYNDIIYESLNIAKASEKYWTVHEILDKNNVVIPIKFSIFTDSFLATEFLLKSSFL